MQNWVGFVTFVNSFVPFVFNSIQSVISLTGAKNQGDSLPASFFIILDGY